MSRRIRERSLLAWRRFWLLGSAALVAWLVWFHALLLWERLGDLSLFQPAVGLKWLAGLAVLAAWVRLRRQAGPPLRGRRALALGLLLLLVHVQLPAAPGLAAAGGEHSAELLVALPVTLSLVTLWWRGRRLTGLATVETRPEPPRSFPAAGPRQRLLLLSGHLPSLSSRPPPL